MAKAIKRVGVIFLAVAIICLMAIGVILGISDVKNGLNFNESLLDLDNKVNEANDIREDEIPPIDEEIFLDGTTCDAQAKIWNQAAQKARAGKHILVTMKEDWIAAPHSDYESSFAETGAYLANGSGLSRGRIMVPLDTTMTLDLNGHTIDRRLLSTNQEYGAVIYVNGTLHLKDSKYNSLAIQNAYNANPTSADLLGVAESTGAGKITGGSAKHSGGAFIVNASSKLYMYGGVICNNKAVTYGGGIFVYEQASVKIYDGLITSNKASSGAGICVRDDAKISFYNGFVYNNTVTKSGAGMNFINLTSPANIYGGVFARNNAIDDGGAIFASNSPLNVYGGIYDRNITSGASTSCGGGICTVNAVLNISGAKITNNECGSLGGGVYNQGETGITTISDTLITGNKARKHGDINATINGGAVMSTSGAQLRLGAGCLIYTNTANGSTNNVVAINPIEIYENLVGNGKAFRVAVNVSSGVVFTSGLRAHKSSLTANQLFLADNNMTINESAGEAIIGTTANTAQSITWKWGTGANQNALNYAEIPYTGQTYTISAVVTGTSTAVSIRPAAGTSSLNIKEPGRYSFYTTGNYRASSFQIRILEPKEKVAKPTEPTENAFIYGGVQQKFEPQGFDSSKMEIAYNRATEPGQYTATVRLKDAWNTTWADGSTGNLTFTYKIIRDSVIGANSEYDYVYKDDENKRQNYTDNKVYHKYNDNSLNVVNGTPRYVIGNINANTSVRDFITKLHSEEITKVKLFDSNGTLIYNGTTQSSSYDISKTIVQTGWYLTYSNYYGNTETIYLSVLGDVVADGVINTLDITYINRIARGEIKLETLNIEQQLAAMVDNKGKVTSTDGKILLNVIGGNTEVDNYFENVTQKDDYQILVLNSTSGKTYRQNMNLTTLNVYDNAIIGNIAPQTKASEFKTKLASQLGVDISTIAVYKANRAIANDDDYIGTGYYINYNGNTADKIYLSVLGDLTGDGIVNTMDVTYLNRIISGNVQLNINDIKDKLIMLSAIIQNKGNLTTADSETLLNYIGGNADMTKYF